MFYDLTQGEQAARVLTGEYSCTMLFARENEALLLVDGQEVRLHDATTGVVLQSFDGHTEAVSSVAISPDNRYLATSQRYGIRLFDMESGDLLQHYTQQANGSIVYGGDVFFSPDGILLGASTKDGTYIWDLVTGAWVDVYASYRTGAGAFFSPDGTRLLVYSNPPANFLLLDAANGDELQTGSYLNSVSPIVFSPNSQYFVVSTLTSTTDKQQRIYETRTGMLHLSLTHESNFAAFNPDATLLATVADKLYFWDTATGALLATYAIDQEIRSMAFRDNGTQFVTRTDNTVALWQASAGTSTVVQCPGFLPSRLNSAAQAQVLPGLPNNLRAAAGTAAEKIGEIPVAATMTVLAGPLCANGLAWWQVDYQGLVGWTAEGADNEYYLEPMP